MATIDEILSGSQTPQPSTPSPEPVAAQPAPEAQVSEPVPTPAPSAESEQAAPPEAAESKDAPAEEPGPSKGGPPPPAAGNEEVDDPKVRAFKAKAQDETRKRQDYEKQLKQRDDELTALRKQLADIQAPKPALAQPQQPIAQPQPQRQPPPRRNAPPPPDPDVDPGAALRYLARAQQAEVQRIQGEFDRKFQEQLIINSQQVARIRHADYNEMETVFADEADKNPALYQQMRAQPDPAQFAYEMGRRIKALKEVGDDPFAWKAKQEEDFKTREEAIRKQIEDEFAARYAQPSPPVPPAPKPAAPARAPAAPSPPPSLAGVTSAAPRSPTKVFEGPTPLKNLLG